MRHTDGEALSIVELDDRNVDEKTHCSTYEKRLEPENGII